MHAKEKHYHNTLAEYFTDQPLFHNDDLAKPNSRKCTEQVYQLTQSQLWDEVTKTLCDLLFLEAKSKAGFVEELQDDYGTALISMPVDKNMSLKTVSREFLRQKHEISERPSLAFQQMYNELQWRNGRIKELAEQARNKFIEIGGRFLHQHRIPEWVKSHLVMPLKGHSDRVEACAYSPDSSRIVSASADNTLKIWDAETGKEIATLKGHGSTVNACTYSPDGRRIISACEDGTLKVWDAQTGKEIMSLQGHNARRAAVLGELRINSCYYSPDGGCIVMAGLDSILNIWDAQTGKELGTYLGEALMTAIAISGCGNKIACGNSKGNIYFLKLEGFTPALPLVTGVRLWVSDAARISRTLSPTMTAACPYCGVRSSVPAPILNAIADINKKHYIGPNDSPCSKLPSETWNDPRLVSECPTCKKPLKFNPFVVDNTKSPM